MLRKRFLSLTCALALCLSLLPATALAADMNTVYVGGVALTGSSDSIVYAITNKSGEVITKDATANNYNIKWDGSTLTLKNAYITNAAHGDSYLHPVEGAAIGVANSSGNAELTIQLESGNTIEDVSLGIWVYSSATGYASLTITGDGNLTASGSVNPGILVQSNDGNATLSIENAEVTTTSSSYCGVEVRAKDSSNASLTVNGGSLTATCKSEHGAGIQYTFGGSSSGSGKPSLTVSGNATVRANGSAGGITNNSSTGVQTKADTDGTGGIVFDGNTGTVYGSVELQKNLTIGEGESLDIPSGASLTIDSGATLTVNGGELTGNIPTNGVVYKVTGVTLSETTLTLEVGGTATLTATVEPDEASNKNVTWSSSPDNIVTIAPDTTDSKKATVTATGTGTTTITATVDGKSAECSVTVNAAATVPVTSVSLNKTSLELTEGETAQLNATVLPSNATNKDVTWESSNTSVATVDASGLVTAVGAGTATITVTTQDGNHTDTCTVTVRPDIPPANPNYKITVEATQGGTVTADPTAAKAGATVTLTPVPHRGYQVGTVAVTDRFGEPVAVTEQADGTYTFTMPNGQVTVTVTFAEAPLPFPDVTEGDWFYDAVRYAYETGLMDGVGDNLFAPNSETTRAQLVTILYRLAGEPEPGGDSGFSDVAAGTWYTDAVAWAAENGIVNGTTDTTFAPGEDITREQLVTILFRYAEAKGYDVSAAADLSGFPDAGDIQSYATQALSWAVAEGLLQGFEDDTIRPGGTATRAQIATILMRFCEGVGQ